MSERLKKGIPPIRPLAELTLMDRFLFSCAMENPEILRLVLEMILGHEMVPAAQAQTEKELRTTPWLRSVRLDVFTTDEKGRIYNAEVQKKNTGNLIKRWRFYQALTDSSWLAVGEVDFNRLPDVCMIMIAPIDLFGHGRYRYTFRMKCDEVDGLRMGDGVLRVFLNTKGTNPEEVSQELVELLRYFEDTTDQTVSECRCERIHRIHELVAGIKSREEIGVKYMQAWEELAYERMEGLEEGKKSGIFILIQDNLYEGRPPERILEKLRRLYDLSEAQALEYLREFERKMVTS